MLVPQIDTERLTLRAITAADVSRLYAIFGDARVMRYWSSPPIDGIDGAQRLFQEITAGYGGLDWMQLGIAHRDSGQLIGTCTLHERHVASRRAQIGYALAYAFWGQGFMAEALRAFVRYLFIELDLNRLEADIDPANTASARSLERLGFVKEGFCPERWIVGGEKSDSVLYGLLAARWRQAAGQQDHHAFAKDPL